MKYVSIAIKTTGQDTEYSQVLSIEAIVDDLEVQKPLTMLPRFYVYLSYPRIMGSPFALSLHTEILKKLAENPFPMTLEDIRQRDADSKKYIDIVVDGRSTIPSILFRSFLKENGYDNDGDIDERGRIHFIPAGEKFDLFDRVFLKSLPGFVNQVCMEHRCLDPWILYLKPGEMHVNPNQINNAFSTIKLLREKWTRGVGFVVSPCGSLSIN